MRESALPDIEIETALAPRSGVRRDDSMALAQPPSGDVEPDRREHTPPQLADLLLRRQASARSHCRFRNRGTDSLSEYGIKWMSDLVAKLFSAKR